MPSFINREWYTEDPETNKLMGDAMLALGNLSTLAKHFRHVDIYIKMHIRTEANCSSRIEGTRTTLEEDLLPIEEIAPEKRDDYREVQNYLWNFICKVRGDSLHKDMRAVPEAAVGFLC